jgi:hypothetical protein
MCSQLSFTAAKLEIADRQHRAERQLACDRPSKTRRHPRRGSLARLVRLRRGAPATGLARAGNEAA